MGPGARLPGGRRGRRGSLVCGAAVARMAGARLAWRDGVYGGARRASRPPGGVQAGDPEGHLLPDGLFEIHRRDFSREENPCLHRPLRSWPRLSQGAAQPPAGPVHPHRAGSGAFRLPRVHRLRAGDGGGACGARRDRLARQAHAAPRSRCGLLVFPRRDLLRPTASARRSRKKPLRHLRALHRDLSHPGYRCALPARRAALHFLPHHRAQERDSRGAASAHRQPRLRLRRLPAGLPVEPVCPPFRGTRLRRAQRPRPGQPRRAVLLDRGRVRRAAAGLADPAHRLRALAEEPGGGIGKCAPRLQKLFRF